MSVGAVPSTPPLSPGGGRGVLREAVVVVLSSGTSPASQTDTRGGGSTWMYGEGLSPLWPGGPSPKSRLDNGGEGEVGQGQRVTEQVRECVFLMTS